MSNVQEQVSHAVESAKEAVGKVGEQVSDFFQGNPFTTPVGRKIELATDINLLASENWGLNMEICDFINSTEEGPKDAIRAIRKRLHTQMAKNNGIVMYTLTVLETCVKNCNHRFHLLACQKDFILDLVKLIGPKFDAPQIIQERVLSLIQAWADAFRNTPDLQGVCQVYDDLKAKGVEFPATDLDTLAPILTPKRTVYPSEPPREVRIMPSSQSYQVAPSTETPVEIDTEQLAKLRKDMDVVNTNMKVFREMLTEIVPSKATEDELQLILELNQTCRVMQQRLLELIRTIANEEVTCELLVSNDDFNSLFERYERFMSNKEGDKQPESSVQLIDLREPASVSEQLSNMKVTTAANSAKTTDEEYKANAEPQAAVGLRAASGDKTVPVSEREAAEMADWFDKQGGPKGDPENDKL